MGDDPGEERRPGQIPEGHDLAEDSARQANVHGGGMLRPSPYDGTLRLPNDNDDPTMAEDGERCVCEPIARAKNNFQLIALNRRSRLG